MLSLSLANVNIKPALKIKLMADLAEVGTNK